MRERFSRGVPWMLLPLVLLLLASVGTRKVMSFATALVIFFWKSRHGWPLLAGQQVLRQCTSVNGKMLATASRKGEE